jgi:hypothetical protein
MLKLPLFLLTSVLLCSMTIQTVLLPATAARIRCTDAITLRNRYRSIELDARRQASRTTSPSRKLVFLNQADQARRQANYYNTLIVRRQCR